MHPTDVIKNLQELLRHVEDVDAGAAVTILLRIEGRSLQVLLVQRAAHPSDPWSGHMAFPGGRRRHEDENIHQTVIRETLEETGIDLSGCRFLGTLDIAASTVVPELGVLPFVILCNEAPRITLNEELRAYSWVPLEHLRRSKGKARIKEGEVPAYIVNGEVVWGLTYRMLENLLELMETSGDKVRAG